jgi:hypothetical protein
MQGWYRHKTNRGWLHTEASALDHFVAKSIVAI